MTEQLAQGSPEWLQARVGKVTASRVADVAAKTKTGWGASRANYMAQLIAERLTGNVQESFTNGAMQWGTEKEPEARAAYEFYRNETDCEAGSCYGGGCWILNCSACGNQVEQVPEVEP